MSVTDFITQTPDTSSYRNASQEGLRDMVLRHVMLALSLDPLLHILAEKIDRSAIDEQIAGLFSRFPDPARRPPLFGVPVGVKDIFRIDGASIRCGSLLPPVFF